MKKIFTAVIAGAMMLIGTSAFGQASIGAGLVMPMNTGANLLSSGTETTTLSGFYAGLNYNIGFGNSGLGLAPGVYFNYATKSENNIDRKQMYLSAPVMLNLGLQLTPGFVIRPYAGPTFAYGLKDEISGAVNTTNWYDNDNYNRFNIQVGGGIAFEFFDMVRFDAGYDYGLTKIYDTTAGSLTKNQFHVGVAYIF